MENVVFHQPAPTQVTSVETWENIRGITDTSIAQFLARPIKLLSYDLAKVPNCSLGFFPQAALNTEIKKKIEGFPYIRTEIALDFKVVASKQSYGLYVAAWYPPRDITGNVEVFNTRDNFYAAMQQPHVMIAVGSNQPVRLILPCFCPDMFPLNTVNNISNGEVRVYEVIPISQVGDVVGSPTLTVYASWLNTQLVGEEPITLQSYRGVKSHARFPLDSDEAETYFSRVGNAPTRIVNEYANFYRTFGDDPAVTTAISPDNGVDSAVGFSASIASMNVQKLCSTQTPVDMITWSTDVQAGVFGYTPVYPKAVHMGNIGTMNFISQAFRYWRGSINYTIRVVSPPGINGRIRIIWDPNPVRKQTLNETAFGYKEIFDVTGDTEIKFSVPWLTGDFWKSTDVVNGYLYYQVEAPFSTIGDLVTDIVLLVSSGAGKDFELAFPSIPPTTGYWSVPPAVTSDSLLKRMIPMLSATKVPTDFSDSSSDPLEIQSSGEEYPGIGGSKSIIVDTTIGETITTLDGLLRRPALSYETTQSDFKFCPFVNTIQVTNDPRYIQTPLFYFGQMFAACRGSINVTIVPANKDDTVEANLVPYDGIYTTYTPTYSGSYISTATSGPVHLIVPFYSTQQFVWTFPNSSTEFIWGITVSVRNRTTDAPSTTGCAVYIAAGDDFQFLMPMAPLPPTSLGVSSDTLALQHPTLLKPSTQRLLGYKPRPQRDLKSPNNSAGRRNK